MALPIGKAEVISDGDEIAILGLGALLPHGAGTRRRSSSSRAFPLPSSIRASSSRSTAIFLPTTHRRVSVFVTLEDHVLMGGFGSAVLEALSDMRFDVPVVRIGWPDRFIEHGKVDPLRARYGISVETALEKLAPYLEHRTRKRLVAR